MENQSSRSEPHTPTARETSSPRPRTTRQRFPRPILFALSIFALLTVAAGWLAVKANTVSSQLNAAVELLPRLKEEIAASDVDAAKQTASEFRSHTFVARHEVEDPVWTLASGLPWIGANLSAVSEVARSADDVANLGLIPLVSVYSSLDWDTLVPRGSGANLEPLRAASPKVTAAAYAVRTSLERLEAIDSRPLMSRVAQPLDQATQQLRDVTGALDTAADVANIAPDMLGASGPRHFLLIVQNNAEARASGGIPGALAVITLEGGRLSLGSQSSAVELGTVSPNVEVDPQQEQIYSARLGKYMQDVNLTPDFPTAASTAQAMWHLKTGQDLDGVLSLDPVVLGYILQATGPVAVDGPEEATLTAAGLPTELTATNVVPTLLSDVYSRIQKPELQDAYFAGVAKEVFSALSSGKGETRSLVAGITRGAEEGRVLMWSSKLAEQSVLTRYKVGGSISGPSVPAAQFGVYFNDGTGAKMDYYVQRKVQLVQTCAAGGYGQTRVRVTSTNTAPSNAGTALPNYVTGGGAFGVPPGTVRTNVVAYGPVQAHVESVTVNGEKVAFAPYLHSNRPVGVVAQQLAPGENETVEFTFGKIVQHVEPALFVTPSVQPLRDVVLPTENESCDQGN